MEKYFYYKYRKLYGLVYILFKMVKVDANGSPKGKGKRFEELDEYVIVNSEYVKYKTAAPKNLLTGKEQWGYRTPVDNFKEKFRLTKYRLDQNVFMEKLRHLNNNL